MKQLTKEMADEYREYLDRRRNPGYGFLADVIEFAFYSGATCGFMFAVEMQDDDQISVFEISAATQQSLNIFYEIVNEELRKANV